MFLATLQTQTHAAVSLLLDAIENTLDCVSESALQWNKALRPVPDLSHKYQRIKRTLKEGFESYLEEINNYKIEIPKA